MMAITTDSSNEHENQTKEETKKAQSISLTFENFIDLQTRLVLLPYNDSECTGAVIHSFKYSYSTKEECDGGATAGDGDGDADADKSSGGNDGNGKEGGDNNSTIENIPQEGSNDADGKIMASEKIDPMKEKDSRTTNNNDDEQHNVDGINNKAVNQDESSDEVDASKESTNDSKENGANGQIAM